MRGSEATEPERAERARGEGVGGGVPPPTVGRFFENSCMKTAFSSTLNDIIHNWQNNKHQILQFVVALLLVMDA